MRFSQRGPSSSCMMKTSAIINRSSNTLQTLKSPGKVLPLTFPVKGGQRPADSVTFMAFCQVGESLNNGFMTATSLVLRNLCPYIKTI